MDTKNQYPYPNTRISVKITPVPHAHGPHRHNPQGHKRSAGFQQSSEALARPVGLHLSFSPPLSSLTRPLLPPPPTPSHLSQTPAAAARYRSGSLAPCAAPTADRSPQRKDLQLVLSPCIPDSLRAWPPARSTPVPCALCLVAARLRPAPLSPCACYLPSVPGSCVVVPV
jgi:hypothetical protein